MLGRSERIQCYRAPRDRSSDFRNDRISMRFRKHDTGGEGEEDIKAFRADDRVTRVRGKVSAGKSDHPRREWALFCTAALHQLYGKRSKERRTVWEKPVHFAETRFRSTALSLSSDPEDTRRPSSRSVLCIAFTVSRHPRLGKSHG